MYALYFGTGFWLGETKLLNSWKEETKTLEFLGKEVFIFFFVFCVIIL